MATKSNKKGAKGGNKKNSSSKKGSKKGSKKAGKKSIEVIEEPTVSPLTEETMASEAPEPAEQQAEAATPNWPLIQLQQNFNRIITSHRTPLNKAGIQELIKKIPSLYIINVVYSEADNNVQAYYLEITDRNTNEKVRVPKNPDTMYQLSA